MPRYILLVFLIACGGGPGCGSRSETAHSETPSLPEPTAPSPIQSVNEWGLVSVGPRGVELAAGPGTQQLSLQQVFTIDKPVLYVHASAPTSLHVEVTPGEGMSVAEHFPHVAGPLVWNVEVTPGECTTPRDYTGSCNSTDGYCETHELALYETSDADCLTQGELNVPLLFYRLRADDEPAMPLSVDGGNENEVVLFNTGLEAGASIWRVTWDGAQAHATRAVAPAAGEQLVIQRAVQGGVVDVRAAIRQDLAGLGLTRHEAEAFMRAWDSALFGAQGSIDGELADEDGTPTDIPVRDIDSLTSDETILDRRVIPGAPRVTDAILYWLPAAHIEAMSALTFRPAPQVVHRAILVRVDAR
ncbi:MAG: hypothetical protein ACI9KE_005401 [Polyangiales bacterium]|jgi:hypothetical protein